MTRPIIITRTFPWTDKIDGTQATFRLMQPTDVEAVEAMAKGLSHEDLAYLRMDIREDSVLQEWLDNIERGRTITVLVEIDEQVAGYGSLHHNEVLWTSHMGEIRVLVRPENRGIGIAHRLVAELCHIAAEMKLQRVFCQIPAEQEPVRRMFEELGFQPEAFLNDWILLPDGESRDLLVLSHYLEPFGG